ncbi:dream [Drosophila busckii]|uniref:Dream n=1 Tax=Drosophila busckii TaxID=30019 RepID=A0A0M4EFJ7_DROBS|nr:cell death protein 3 [Drosophila busckii]ALC42138.1 dream [Drosophila busckii]
MGWFSKKKQTDDCGGGDAHRALALQDPRTRVNTTSAATETTNTAVQNSTIFDSNKQTVTFMSTRQTVTHTQQARVTEMITRRTPSQAELEELLSQLPMNGGNRASLTGVSMRSTPTVQTNAEAKRSSTVIKTEQTTVSQKHGRSVTQHVETKRVVLSPGQSKFKYTTTTSSKPTAGSASSAASNKDKTYVSPYANKPLSIGYVSPYTTKTSSSSSSSSSAGVGGTSTIYAKPQVSSTVLAKPSVSSSVLTKPQVSSANSVKPVAKLTIPKAFVSLNPSTGAVPKRASNSTDAQGRNGLTNITPVSSVSTKTLKNLKKLKPALVYIFNHEKFDNQNEFRDGSANDVKSLKSSFQALRCSVQIIPNATLSVVKSTVRQLEVKNFAEYSALVLVILSHGQRYDTIAAKDGEYRLDDDLIFPIVRNRTLLDKPKILFVQACKGSREMGQFKTDAAQPHGSPSEILKCYSTYEGYVSYRLDDGTPFIQTLCEALKNKPRTDIETIMTDVRRTVKQITKDSQIPSVTSTLTQKYTFGDYL